MTAAPLSRQPRLPASAVRPGQAARYRAARRARAASLNGIALIIALVTLFPIFWMISTAFKPSQEIYSLTPQPAAGPPDAAQLQPRSSAARRPGSARSGCSSATA